MNINIANTDVIRLSADLLAVKHADGFFGADAAVAKAIGFFGHVEAGQARFVEGKGLAAPEVLFLGVGPLWEFRYERIQEFGARVVKTARQHKRTIRHIGLTIHGPGYGLDPEPSFLSMIAGIVDEWTIDKGNLELITIAERSESRCEIFKNILKEQSEALKALSGNIPFRAEQFFGQDSYGARAEELPRLFTAMPFADEFDDEFYIGFCEAAKANGYICERLDLETFTGDIVTEIKRRITESYGVIALLNNHNPNVFLEIGFAWAQGKPTILVAKEGEKLPFDVSGHKCIRYRNIIQLRKALNSQIAILKTSGVLARSV